MLLNKGNPINSKKYSYVKIMETERDIEFHEEESNFNEDMIDLEF